MSFVASRIGYFAISIAPMYTVALAWPFSSTAKP